ncbi:Gfo/Idh/MocA family oxidoreductase [Halogeometricum sp. S1BR25-6]|uniref:Gfo/Idh/MocA family oxidoreductase n=1 Tax=Halogeometricum salsisoli TaxID=2950536 RepID=A0ABU2GLH1_9EURY|nr:Gfo/Idh/MocA family oxidoreductase [Halogeometricum sp. S1BR25-6]MDS0301138.1 Gfo/Idh/MocA family oxidoreductase [Halogeometricum sp. S1BR25-6]
MDSLSVAIVGAGNRGAAHIETVYSQTDSADVATVVDIDEERASAFADRYGVPTTHTDYRDALDDDSLDIVDICVHNNLHAPIAVDALDAGKHVYSEKPMAGSYADAEAMYEAAERNDRELAVQNVYLYAAETRAAKRLIDDGRLGSLYYGHAAYKRVRGRPYINGYGTASFQQEATAGGGPVYDLGTYPIGQLLYLLGNPDVERVSGATFDGTDELFSEEHVGDNLDRYESRLSEGDPMEDVGFGFVRLADGKILTVEAAWGMFADDSDTSAVVGATGGIELDPFEFRTTMADTELSATVEVDDFARRERRFAADDPAQNADLWDNDLYQWIRGIQEDDSAIPTAEIALNSMLVMEGIYLSNEFGREVTAEEVKDHSKSTALDP